MAFEKTSETFGENGGDIAAEGRLSPEEAARLRMSSLIEKIRATPDGEGLLKFLQDNGVMFRFSRDVETAGFACTSLPDKGTWHTDPASKHIALNPDKPDINLIESFLHEARHAQQAMAGALQPTNHVSPMEMAWYTRFIEADAQSEAVIKTFKMKLAGDGSVFETAKNSVYRDMFETAEREYARDPAALDDGRLRRMVFDTWFSLNIKHDYDLYSAQKKFPYRVQMLEMLPDNGLQNKALDIGDLEKLGTVGGEAVNYLTLPGFKPLSDMQYLGDFRPGTLNALNEMKTVWDNFLQHSPSAASAFKQEVEEACDAGAPKPDTSPERMDRIIHKLLASAEGVALATFLLENKIPILFMPDNEGTRFYSDITIQKGAVNVIPGSAKMLLDPAEGDDKLIALIFHEGRHAKQYMAGLALPGKVLSPQHVAIYTRMLEADAESAAVIAAFRLKLAGDDSVWKAAYCDGYEPMFDAAEAFYKKDPAALDNGDLRRAAFDAWFTPELRHTYDMRSLTRKFPWLIETLATNPGNGFVREGLTIGDLDKLGTLDGTNVNYLQLPGKKSLADPAYTENFSPAASKALETMTAAWLRNAPAPVQKTAIAPSSAR